MILDPNGNVYYDNGSIPKLPGSEGIPLDTYHLLNEWSALSPSFHFGGIKYIVLTNRYPKYIVARSLGENAGFLIVVQTPINYYFVSWTPIDSGYAIQEILPELQEMAEYFK